MGVALESRLAEIAEAYGLDTLYVFGSRAREIAARLPPAPHDEVEANSPIPVPSPGSAIEPAPTSKPESDVDIGVQPQRQVHLTARERVRLTLLLEETLAVSRVDLVILPEANPFLAAEIVRGELLYARDLDQEAETQLYYLRRAGDLAPFFREQWRQVVGGEL